MPKVLVVHGAGMNMRGKVEFEIFGPLTLADYDTYIRKSAANLEIEVEIFHSNIEGEVINKIHEAHDRNFDAAIINPAGYSSGYPALVKAIRRVKFPTIEVHVTNPARTEPESMTVKVCRAVAAGFGIATYDLALRGILEILAAAKSSDQPQR
jgi:3-dehydroquinate dehydratase II